MTKRLTDAEMIAEINARMSNMSFSIEDDICVRGLMEVMELRRVLNLAVLLRSKQKTYFKTRTQATLIESKTAERAFDDAWPKVMAPPAETPNG